MSKHFTKHPALTAILAVSCLALGCLAMGCLHFAPAAAAEPGRSAATPLEESAGSYIPAEWRLSAQRDIGTAVPAGRAAGWLRFWKAHRYHVLTVFLANEVEYQYARQVGVSREPLFWKTAPRIDQAVRDSLYEDGAGGTFIEGNRTNVLRAVALASILGTNHLTWNDVSSDLMGLIEAQKFNTPTTSLVKMIVGRKRPKLDMADASEIGQEQYDAIQAGGGGHLSFYSAATSEAFTYCSYIDRVVARHLEGHRGARIASGIGLYALAGYIGYTRLQQGEHYLSDVLAGAAAGIAIGHGFYRANHRPIKTGDAPPESRWRLNAPVGLPGGALVTVSIQIDR
jgi:hypothetical protein